MNSETEDQRIATREILEFIGLEERDGWTVIESPYFPGFFQIEKPRKHEDAISVHVNRETGRVRKFAGEASNNPKIKKEIEMWGKALEVFGIEERIEVGSIKLSRKDPCKGCVDVLYLDMPYLGVPIGYYKRTNSNPIPEEAIEKFKRKMMELAQKHNIFFVIIMKVIYLLWLIKKEMWYFFQ